MGLAHSFRDYVLVNDIETGKKKKRKKKLVTTVHSSDLFKLMTIPLLLLVERRDEDYSII